MSDNFKFYLTSDKDIHLDLMVKILFSVHKSVVGWKEEKNKGLILYWTDSKGITKFPSPVTKQETLVRIIKEWLESQDYGEEPDHDGSNYKGFTMYNESWGHVNNEWEAFVAIKPEWCMYGK